jgi:GH43 family beta-xylosidase
VFSEANTITIAQRHVDGAISEIKLAPEQAPILGKWLIAAAACYRCTEDAASTKSPEQG